MSSVRIRIGSLETLALFLMSFLEVAVWALSHSSFAHRYEVIVSAPGFKFRKAGWGGVLDEGMRAGESLQKV